MFNRNRKWQKLLEFKDETIIDDSNLQKTSAKLHPSEIKKIKNTEEKRHVTSLFPAKKTERISHNKSNGMGAIYYGPGKKP